MMEQLVHSPDGNLLTKGPGAYKIPGFGDVPAEFNVSLLRGASNPRAVFSSKAVGEPPLFLAASVFFAAKSAIGEARSGGGAEVLPGSLEQRVRLFHSRSRQRSLCGKNKIFLHYYSPSLLPSSLNHQKRIFRPSYISCPSSRFAGAPRE